MTPSARISAAIGILDHILAGENAERALTNWGRASRFAGSGDRSAVRDLVYDALRCRNSFAALGGSLSGRGLMIGAARAQGADLDALFTGVGHAPAEVATTEAGQAPNAEDAADLPHWLIPAMEASLGADYAAVAQALRQRAPIFLRVNRLKATVSAAVKALAEEGISAQHHDLAPDALMVTEGARKIQNSQSYLTGLVELQDAASQAVVAALPLEDGMKVLDHCAGGGGKTLALAARAKVQLFAHDVAPQRMRDLPARAARAGARVTLTQTPEAQGPYDLVLADAPCSGSGSWRRDPQGKWLLTPESLAKTVEIQAQILTRIAPMVAEGGALAYATCSLLRQENQDQIAAFLAANEGWALDYQRAFTPLDGGDGFFVAVLRRKA